MAYKNAKIKAKQVSVSEQMSKKHYNFIGGAVCREFESEAPMAEEMLDGVVCSSKQFSFQMCLESGDGSKTFHNQRQRVLVPRVRIQISHFVFIKHNAIITVCTSPIITITY